MWKALKDLSGWTSRDTVSSTVLDEAKKEVEGEEVWSESFRVLGIEDLEDGKFEKDFGQRVVREQEELRAQSFLPRNIVPALIKISPLEKLL